MCRSKAEGGRRCECHLSPAENRARMDLANRNRKRGRAARCAYIEYMQDAYGFDAKDRKALFENLRPSDIAAVNAWLAEVDPDGAQEALDAVTDATGKSELPGVHNMIMQEYRNPDLAPIDRDARGNAKVDPRRVSGSIDSMLKLEDAYLKSPAAKQHLSRAELARRKADHKLREKARDHEVYSNPTGRTAGAFLDGIDPGELSAITAPFSAMENQVAEAMVRDSDVVVGPRPPLADRAIDRLETPESLLGEASTQKAKKGIEVRDGVRLYWDADRRGYCYEVTDPHLAHPVVLDAHPKARIMDATANIPAVESVSYDTENCPQGLKSVFQRVCDPDHPSFKNYQHAMTETAIKQVYQSRTPVTERVSAKGEYYVAPGKRAAFTTQTVLRMARGRESLAGSITRPSTLQDEQTMHLARNMVDGIKMVPSPTRMTPKAAENFGKAFEMKAAGRMSGRGGFRPRGGDGDDRLPREEVTGHLACGSRGVSRAGLELMVRSANRGTVRDPGASRTLRRDATNDEIRDYTRLQRANEEYQNLINRGKAVARPKIVEVNVAPETLERWDDLTKGSAARLNRRTKPDNFAVFDEFIGGYTGPAKRNPRGTKKVRFISRKAMPTSESTAVVGGGAKFIRCPDITETDPKTGHKQKVVYYFDVDDAGPLGLLSTQNAEIDIEELVNPSRGKKNNP